MVQLLAVSKVVLVAEEGLTHKHPRRNNAKKDHFFFTESWAAYTAGSGAKRMMLLKKTCNEPMIMQDFLL
jgi:hypothetical protein